MAVSSAVRALRGATTIDVDTAEHMEERIVALLSEMFERNDIHHSDLISVVFTATSDINSALATCRCSAPRSWTSKTEPRCACGC